MAQPWSGMVLVFEDDFTGQGLDRAVWLPHYLPAWSSRAATAADYRVEDSWVRLAVPEEHPVWCADDHDPALRVSGLQSGSFSGPVGSTRGQQPYRDGLVVREQQEEFWGWTPRDGYLEVRARADLTQRSMAAFWLVGRETRPEESAEICVMEVFGNTVEGRERAAVGMGLHSFRDPGVPEDFEAVRLPLDVSEPHRYGALWTAGRVDFFVDDEPVRGCARPPRYPVQAMVAVFDFPALAVPGEPYVEPALHVDHVRHYRTPEAASGTP